MGNAVNGDTLGVGVGGPLTQTWRVSGRLPGEWDSWAEDSTGVLIADPAGLGRDPRHHRDVDSGL